VERFHIHLLSRYEFVLGISSHIVDEVNQKWVVERMLGQQYNLGSLRGQFAHNCLAYTTGASLEILSLCADYMRLSYILSPESPSRALCDRSCW
jgi:hypothetical protein